MQTERTTSTITDRLTPEEVSAIRRRLADGDGNLPDFRTYGAATLDDVAEAVGLTPDEVRRQLDRIRAERAVPSAVPARKDQRALLAFAVVLLAAAYPIHLLNPRKLTDEEVLSGMEERVAESRARRKAHPVVHYPIVTKVRLGALPPAGFTIDFQGQLTDTTVVPGPSTNGPLERNAARTALVEAVLNVYEVARAAERDAPKPDHPLPAPKGFMGNMEPKPDAGTLVYSVGTTSYVPHTSLPIDPMPGFSPAQWDEEVRRRIEATVDGLLDGLMKGQEASLKVEPPRWGNAVMPPTGYTIAFSGRQVSGSNSTSLVILPYDAAGVARKLTWAVRHLIWHDADPPDFSSPESNAAFAKKPTPAYANVTFHGPGGDVVFNLPMTASKKYPNAAAAARAADRILDEAVRKAAAQVGSPGAPSRPEASSRPVVVGIPGVPGSSVKVGMSVSGASRR